MLVIYFVSDAFNTQEHYRTFTASLLETMTQQQRNQGQQQQHRTVLNIGRSCDDHRACSRYSNPLLEKEYFVFKPSIVFRRRHGPSLRPPSRCSRPVCPATSPPRLQLVPHRRTPAQHKPSVANRQPGSTGSATVLVRVCKAPAR